MWKDKLERIIQEKKMYGEEINIGASKSEINALIQEMKDKLNLDLPDEYLRILENVSGLEFNGFILYGIDERLLNNRQNRTINGVIEYNEIWYENEWQKQYIFLGESNISWYVYDLSSCKYCELDNPSGRENSTFDNLESLMEKLLSDALE